jgi:hypothetical protein
LPWLPSIGLEHVPRRTTATGTTAAVERRRLETFTSATKFSKPFGGFVRAVEKPV